MVLPIEPPSVEAPCKPSPILEPQTAAPNLSPLSVFGGVSPQSHQHLSLCPVNEFPPHLAPLTHTTHLVPVEGNKHSLQLMPMAPTQESSNSLQKTLGSRSLGNSQASSNFMQSTSSLGSNT